MMMLSFLQNGLLNLSWWGILCTGLILTQTTIAAVTLYLHRSQTHRGVDFHPVVNHFFRFWLWLTTGMVTKEWVAIHRKHHARCETENDPHSPKMVGLDTVMWRGAELYRDAAKDHAMLNQFGKGTPDDWLERHIYAAHPVWGIAIMLMVDVLLFGVIGLTVWAIQMAWIPFWAAGVINGVGHYFGYRNFENEDASTNLVPWGFWIGGEELHNNHHTFGTACKFSYHWYEFDIGWLYIRILSTLKLATVRKTPPKLALQAQHQITFDTLQAVISNRYFLAVRYTQQMKGVWQQELKHLQSQASSISIPKAKILSTWLQKEPTLLITTEQQQLKQLLDNSPALAKIYQMRQELSAVWGRSNLSKDELLHKLQTWCAQAEASNIEALAHFAHTLRQARLAA